MKTYYFTFISLACTASLQAASIVTNGDTIGGVTTSLSLDVSGVTKEPFATISNDGSGNLLFTPGVDDTNTDWYLQFNGISIDSSIYTFVQVDFLAAEAGAVGSRWQMYHVDSESTIGGSNNSGQVLADPVALSTTSPFSVVIDLAGGVDGQVWGPGNVTALRFDVFEGNETNKGKTFTITGVTFGSALVPEPSSAFLGAVGALLLLRRRR